MKSRFLLALLSVSALVPTAAMAQVEQVAAEAAQAIVERVSGVRVSEQDAQGAVKAVLHG